jgi:hypothetical protein
LNIISHLTVLYICFLSNSLICRKSCFGLCFDYFLFKGSNSSLEKRSDSDNSVTFLISAAGAMALKFSIISSSSPLLPSIVVASGVDRSGMVGSGVVASGVDSGVVGSVVGSSVVGSGVEGSVVGSSVVGSGVVGSVVGSSVVASVVASEVVGSSVVVAENYQKIRFKL